jgi:hypothetical protein
VECKGITQTSLLKLTLLFDWRGFTGVDVHDMVAEEAFNGSVMITSRRARKARVAFIVGCGIGGQSHNEKK